MAEFSELFPSDDLSTQDVEMATGQPAAETSADPAEHWEQTENAENGLPFPDGAEEEAPSRITYIQYLKSPVVTLLVGHGEDQALLTAHEALLTQSPWFAVTCAKFNHEFAVRAPSPSPTHLPLANHSRQDRRVDLIDEDLDAVGCFLEFLYTGDYFPRKVAGTRDLEHDTATPEVDETGDQLLKHARVYTLAETLGLPALKSLASSKIHCVNSTAKGEIAYARYVYAHTQKEDTAIRAPVVNFWATRSHTLRAEAEDEFRQMCLEFPQFGYDVLSNSVVLCVLLIYLFFVEGKANYLQLVCWMRN
jgi:hypothetical protein